MAKYKMVPLGENVEEMFIGPFGSSLKNENFVDFNEAYCMVYEQKHAIKKTMNLPTRYINKEKYDELKRFNIQGGDIIVSCRGTIGETYIIPDDAPLGIMHPSIMKIRLKEGIYDKYYFNLLLNSRLNKHKVEANGSGIKMAISATELGKELFPVPTMDEQLKIADIIFKISDIVKKRIKELDTLDELVKARFVEMFGDIHNNEKGLEIVTIESVCTLIKDGTHQTPQYTDDNLEGYKFLSSKDVMSQKIDWTNIKYIPADLHEKLYAMIKPQKNDILMSKNGVSYGVAAVNDTDEIFDIYVSLALLRPKKIINPIFFRCAINSPETKRQFDSSIKGIGVPNLHLGEIKKTKIFLPPLSFQNQFADFVHQIDKSKVAVQKALDEAQLLFDSLMQEYFG